METLVIDLNHEHARRLLEDLQLLGAITIRSAENNSTVGRGPATFNALKLDTRGFKFNREEANER
ncbi:hypothetical protein Q5H93_16375 [Hymenobacter sp. ASUV-10]|uniref:Uncharacterized protein n=1 Tax=Hymenobacter aranciens TaxID=3063996 RepID=A0ABT9BDI5_9BACT|nr:hypothetical protein [Hymenobacter sp. ASUV-10]MDO7876322.1 hypothetical protein [Hymenobacter sp. ASUV-10]